MKVGKNQNLFIFLLPTGINNENLAIDRIFFSKIWQIWFIFFMENPSYGLKSYKSLSYSVNFPSSKFFTFTFSKLQGFILIEDIFSQD
jgi:hypothetical protein